MKKFKVWGTTRVSVVRIVETMCRDDALEVFDGAVELEVVDGERYRVKARDERNLLELDIDDEWELCEASEVVELTT